MKKTYWTLILVLMVLALTFISCGKATPSPTSLSTADVLDRASTAFQGVNSFHFLLDHSGGGTPITNGIEMTKAEGDVVRPDKMQASLDGTAMGFSIQVKLVTVAGKTLMTNPVNGNWEAPSDQFQVLNLFDPGSGIGAIIKGIGGVSTLTEEQVSGTLCYHFAGVIVSEALRPLTGVSATGVSIKTEVWIGKNDFLMRQAKLTGKITDNEKDGIVRTLTLSSFNQPANIALPQ